MWKNIVEPCGPQTTIWRIRIACSISKTTNTQSEYVILTTFHCNIRGRNAPVPTIEYIASIVGTGPGPIESHIKKLLMDVRVLSKRHLYELKKFNES
jgi:hypothetical protein